MAEQHDSPLGSEGSYFKDKARKEQERARQKLNALYPLIITFLYLILGTTLKLWHPGWLLFFTIPLYYMRPKTQLQKLCNPCMITLIYFVLGIFFHLWHPGWLIFIAIPAAAIIDKAERRSDKAEALKRDLHGAMDSNQDPEAEINSASFS